MDEHRHIKVVRTEHGRDMRQVHANLVAGGSVGCIIGLHFDDASIFQWLKMMLRSFMRETHGVVATCIHACCMSVRGVFVRGHLH